MKWTTTSIAKAKQNDFNEINSKQKLTHVGSNHGFGPGGCRRIAVLLWRCQCTIDHFLNTNYWLVLGLNVGATFDLRWGVTSSPTNPLGTGSGYQELNAVTANQGANWSLTNGNPRKLRLIGIPIPGDVNHDGVAPFVDLLTGG